MVSSDSFLCKVLDEPADWKARPYSALKDALPQLFQSLTDETVSRYRDVSWIEAELSFTAYAFSVLGHLSTLALPAIVASLAFKRNNLIKVLVSSSEVPFTSPSRARLPSPKFKARWVGIREHVRNFGESRAQRMDIPPIFQDDLTTKLSAKAKPSAIKRKGKKPRVFDAKKPKTQTKAKKTTLLALETFIQEVASEEEIESDAEKRDSNCVCTDNPQEKEKISHKSLPKIKRVEAPRQTSIH
nr:hypothetical protein CFP56_42488 [Quercus suber]